MSSAPHLPLTELLDEIRAIPLGVALLQALDGAGVRIVEDAGKLAEFANDGNVFGLYAPADKTIYMRPDMPAAIGMHLLCHEARHALQISGVRNGMSVTGAFNLSACPDSFAINTRLREIDADVFAVYFLYVHGAERHSAYFADMADGKDGVFAELARGDMYQAFYDVWHARGRSHDEADILQAMAAVATTWLNSKSLPRFYDAMVEQQWSKTVVPVFEEVLRAPQSEWRKPMQGHALQTPAQRRSACAAAAQIYAGLLNDAGCPDYLGQVTAEAYISNVLALAPVSQDMERLVKMHASACGAIARQPRRRF